MTNPAHIGFSEFDCEMMARAYRLAEQGVFSTTPNPNVGCVIVDKHGHILGEGFHVKAGEGHAEVNALFDYQSQSSTQDKSLPQGCTAYVTLEPCSHTNRTGPCALALIKAGINEVVVSCIDPNPQVAGNGIRMLEQANVSVKVGLMKETGEQLNEKFFFRMMHERPFVTVKLAASLDGKTALQSGESKWITGTQSRLDVQIQRAKACAILSGADTVITDNPRLNVRIEELPKSIADKFLSRNKQPLRVIIDSQNRLNRSQYRMFNDKQGALVYNLIHNVKLDQDTLLQQDLPQHELPQQDLPQQDLTQQDLTQQQIAPLRVGDRDFVSLPLLMQDLAAQHVNHLWVEGGAKLSGALFDAGLVDELVLYQAPKFLGKHGRNLSDITSPNKLQDALEGRICNVVQIGDDTRTTIRFK